MGAVQGHESQAVGRLGSGVGQMPDELQDAVGAVPGQADDPALNPEVLVLVSGAVEPDQDLPVVVGQAEHFAVPDLKWVE